MSHFDNWAEQYTLRFSVLMGFTAFILALVCGVYAWWQRGRRAGQQGGSRRRATVSGVVICGLFPVLLGVSVVLMSLFLVVQTFVLLLLTVVSAKRKWSGVRFCTVASVVVLAVVCAAGGRGVLRADQMSLEYPFESLAERLKPAAAVPAAAPELTRSGEKALLRVEGKLQRSQNRTWRGYSHRRASLEMIHASQVLRFVSSEGFGFGRMLGPDIEAARIANLRTRPQPVALLSGSADSTGNRSDLWLPLPTWPGPKPALDDLHENMSHDFADPKTYGWVRDLEHVTGFRPHAVGDLASHTRRFKTSVAGQGSSWQLERIELVSLLKSAEPGVYVSENLPRMDELAGAGRRSLDGFETIALRELQNGESLVIRSQGERVKMMGALRAAKQCSLCHEVPRGTLLGAFSYCFRDQTSASSSE